MAFDKCCAYCGQRTRLSDIDPDHVVALSRGGTNGIGNILPSCRLCNSDKRELSLAEWAADRERRSLPPVRTTWETTDDRYAHLISKDMFERVA
jgi:5-methylcytosine-specific restriction endonuclease McrA